MTGICNCENAISRLASPKKCFPPKCPQNNAPILFLPTWRSSPCHFPLHSVVLTEDPDPGSLFYFSYLFNWPPPGGNFGGPPSSINSSTIYILDLLVVCPPTTPSLFHIQSSACPLHLTGNKPTLLLPGNLKLWLSVLACLSSFPSVRCRCLRSAFLSGRLPQMKDCPPQGRTAATQSFFYISSSHPLLFSFWKKSSSGKSR